MSAADRDGGGRHPQRAHGTDKPASAAGKSARAKARAPKASARGGSAEVSSLAGAARQVLAWSDSVLGIAGAAADVSLGAAKAILVKPAQRAALATAGERLRALREGAGLSLRELGHAVDLSDPALLELVEKGKVALPFEIVLRLAAVLGRNDPVSFVMRFTRAWNPQVWHTLEGLGIGRLAIQAGREREFANLYRASDDARTLSDEEFARVLDFTRSAFELAMTLHEVHTKSPAKPRAQATGAGKRRGAGASR